MPFLAVSQRSVALTCNAREELPREALDVAVWEGRKRIRLEEVKDALTQQIRDDADVVPKVETVPEVDALVSVIPVVGGQGGQDPQLDPRGVAVFLDGPNDLDGTSCVLLSVVGLDHLSKCTLTQETADLIWKGQLGYRRGREAPP